MAELTIFGKRIALLAIAKACDGGVIEISGTGGVLARLRLSEKAFRENGEGGVVANKVAPETDALNTGTATEYSVYNNAGEQLFSGSVGQDLVLSYNVIEKHSIVSLNKFTLQV